MNGIDISSWQDGIYIPGVDADFVIVKATQGTGYINPNWREWADQTLSSGKLLGLYHYAGGEDVYAEADFFLRTVADYIGKAILFLDWESEQNGSYSSHSSWTAPWMNAVRDRTGSTPFIYVSQSIMDMHEFGYPMWIAQYPDYIRDGYQDHPWNEGAYDCAIRQYTSVGDIYGYDGNLDLNKAYFDANQWMAYAGGSAYEPVSPDEIDDLAHRVLNGEFGNGEDRKLSLGSKYYAVQARVNELVGEETHETTDIDDLAQRVINGEFGNGDDRKAALGSNYDAVQERVNEILGCHYIDIEDLAVRTIRGEFGNGQDRRNALGDNYDAVQARVNQILG